MKKVFCIIVVLALLVSMTSCFFLNNPYRRGVEYPDFPDRDLDIYDDAIVFKYDGDEDESEIEYGINDDVDDVAEFYQELFEDDDYIIMEENTSDKDEYYVRGYIDDIYFEISAEEASGETKDYFETVVEITTEKGERIPMLSTPIGVYTYTQEFAASFDQVSASEGHILLIIKLTPIDNQAVSNNFSMMDTRAKIGGDEYKPSLLHTTYGTNSALPKYILAFAIPEEKMDYVAEIVLAESVETTKLVEEEKEETVEEVIEEIIKEKEDKPLDIGFVYTSGSSLHEDIILAKMEEGLGRHDYELETSDSNFDYDAQVSSIMQMISEQKDVLIVFPLMTTSDMWETIVNEAVKNDTKVVFVLNYPRYLDIYNLPNGIFVIDRNSEPLGTMQAEYAIDILDNMGNVAIFKNETEIRILDERAQACIDRLMVSNISADDPVELGWDKAANMAAVTQWIDSGECDNVDAIIVNFDFLAMMVAEALIEKGEADKIIISADGQVDFLDLIRSGSPYATFSVNHSDVGVILADMMDEISDGNINLPVYTMDYELITADNVDDY